MRKEIAALMACLLALAFVGRAETGYRHVTNYRVKKVLEMDVDLAIVDTREADDYEKKHIAGAINIPASTLDGDIAALPDKEQIILTYGYLGAKSRDAAAALVALGYQYVFEFDGLYLWTGETVPPQHCADDCCYGENFYGVSDYADPEDFYYDYYEDFDSYEDAEDYYYENGGW